MIASIISNESNAYVDDVPYESRGDFVPDGRRRSWENRGRSQVLFNGPPPWHLTEDDGQTCLTVRRQRPALDDVVIRSKTTAGPAQCSH